MTVWWGKRGASLFSEGGQIRVEVAPARVHCLYKLALTAAGAGLDLLFPQDGALHRSVQLVPHQPPATVASAKTFLQTFAVLIGPPQEVGSDTSVERPVGAARHDVDGGEFILSHRCLLYQRAGRGVGGRRGIWNEWHLRMDRHCRCATSRGRWGGGGSGSRKRGRQRALRRVVEDDAQGQALAAAQAADAVAQGGAVGAAGAL